MSEKEIKNKKLTVAAGTVAFKDLVTEYDIFIDKTLFIKEIIDTSHKSILLTHPRRWGKTINMDMLNKFFNLDDAESNIKLFAGGEVMLASGEKKVLNPLQIATVDGGKYMRYQGKHPVIFLSLKDVTGDTLDIIEDELKLVISKLFGEHIYLLDNLHVTANSQHIDYAKVVAATQSLAKYMQIYNQKAETIDLSDSISFLCRLLYKHYNQAVYILVDEYDRAVNLLLEKYLGQEKTAEQDELLIRVARLITQTLCSPGKDTTPYVQKLVFAGTYDTMLKESGTGCNNMMIAGISDQDFSRHFGFSAEEVKSLVVKFSFTEPNSILAKIKDWYNGYVVYVSVNDTMQVYNPWSVINYLGDINKKGEKFEPKSYWAESGASTILENLFKKEACTNSTLSHKLLNIALQIEMPLEFTPRISLYKYKLHALLDNEKIFSYLLLNSGYLSVREEKGEYLFSIPNFEVKQEFDTIIKEQIRDIEKSHKGMCSTFSDALYKKQHIEMIKAIRLNDSALVIKILQQVGDKANCDHSALNLNYFHLASLTNNVEILKYLSSKCSGNIKELLVAKDRAFGINSKDYLHLSGVAESKFAPLKNIMASVQLPTDYEYVVCNNMFWYVAYNLIISPAAAGIVKLASKLYTPKDISMMKLYGVLSLTGTAVVIIKDLAQYLDQYQFSQCSIYDVYQSIDSALLLDFTDLKQFAKYCLDHEAYIVLGHNCRQSSNALKTIVLPIFNDGSYEIEELTFTLCQDNRSENNQHIDL